MIAKTATPNPVVEGIRRRNQHLQAGTPRALSARMDVPRKPPLQDAQTFQIIGAALAVHREVGPGFSELVYHEGMTIEFRTRQIPFARETQIPIYYKGQLLPVSWRADFICYGEVLVELKALPGVGPIEYGQVLNYLRASNKQRALLLNFGADRLQYKRIVLNLQNDPVPRD